MMTSSTRRVSPRSTKCDASIGSYGRERKTMRAISLYFTLAIGLLETIAPGGTALAQEKVVAAVDGQIITETDMRLAEIEWGAALANLPQNDRRRTLIAFLIESQLLARAAIDEKLLSKDDAANIERFNNRLGLRNFYFQKRAKDAVTEADARKLYDTQVKAVPLEDEVRARHILLDTQQRAIELKKMISD